MPAAHVAISPERDRAARGIFSGVSVLLIFEALSRGQVVSPVLATNPLFTLFLATVLLRGLEQITLRVIAGTCLVVLGVVVLTVA